MFLDALVGMVTGWMLTTGVALGLWLRERRRAAALRERLQGAHRRSRHLKDELASAEDSCRRLRAALERPGRRERLYTVRGGSA